MKLLKSYNALMKSMNILPNEEGLYCPKDEMDTPLEAANNKISVIGGPESDKKGVVEWHPAREDITKPPGSSIKTTAIIMKLSLSLRIAESISYIATVVSNTDPEEEKDQDVLSLLAEVEPLSIKNAKVVERLLTENFTEMLTVTMLTGKSKGSGFRSVQIRSPLYDELCEVNEQAGRPVVFGITLTKATVRTLISAFDYLLPELEEKGYDSSGKSTPSPSFEALLTMYLSICDDLNRALKPIGGDTIKLPVILRQLFADRESLTDMIMIAGGDNDQEQAKPKGKKSSSLAKRLKKLSSPKIKKKHKKKHKKKVSRKKDPEYEEVDDEDMSVIADFYRGRRRKEPEYEEEGDDHSVLSSKYGGGGGHWGGSFGGKRRREDDWGAPPRRSRRRDDRRSRRRKYENPLR